MYNTVENSSLRGVSSLENKVRIQNAFNKRGKKWYDTHKMQINKKQQVLC